MTLTLIPLCPTYPHQHQIGSGGRGGGKEEVREGGREEVRDVREGGRG